MATTRSPTQTWVGKNCRLYIARYPAVQFTSTDTLSGVFWGTSSGIEISKAVKSITITPPETGYEKLDLLGKDTNTFQNQMLDEKPVGNASINFTTVVGEDEVFEDYVVSGTAATAPTGYTRRQIGNDNSSTNRLILCVDASNSDDTNYKAIGLQDAKMTKFGDIRLPDMGSHLEQDVTFICLAKNYYDEFKD